MKNFKASKRPAYTYQEISGLIKKKLNKENLTIENLQKMYPDISLEKMKAMLNDNKNYSITMLKTASHFLEIPFKKLTEVIEDKTPASFRTNQEVNKDVLSFYELVNDLFDEMIFQSKLRNRKENLENTLNSSKGFKNFNLIKSETNLSNEQIAWQCYINFLEQCNLSNGKIYEIQEIIESCSTENREILYFMFPNNLKVSGIYLKKEDRTKLYDCIYLNSSENKERRRFSFFHELYHAYFEPSNFLVEDITMYDTKDEIEKRANLFAGFMVFPILVFVDECIKLGLINREVTINEVIQLQTKFHASFSATVYFLSNLTQILKMIFPTENPNWNLTVDKSLFKYNFPKHWDELEQKTKEYNSYLEINRNNQIKEYFFPDDFKDDLLENYKNGIITKDDVETIFAIFKEKGNTE